MRVRRAAFEPLYDISYDMDAIEASFLTQYSIRLSKEEMSWREFVALLSNLMPDTPLGLLVRLRGEKDPKVISKMNDEERKLRHDFFAYRAEMAGKKSEEELEKDLRRLFK